MAHQPLYPLDPFDSPGMGAEPRDSEGARGSPAKADAFQITTAELALDVALHAMAEQARLATSATGAAIALATGGKLICRATSGDNSPDLGIAIDAHSGLSGASVQSRRWQVCDDTEADPRVNAETSRRLGIRSVLVVPILDDDRILGLVETFSPRRSAFGERDVQTLQALGRRIVARVTAAADEAAATVEVGTAAVRRVEDTFPANAAEPQGGGTFLDNAPRDGDGNSVGQQPGAHDWTMGLNVLVIATALTLGWFLGHPAGRRAQHRRTAPTSSDRGAAPLIPPRVVPTSVGEIAPSPQTIPNANATEKAAPKSASARTSPGGLTIYQDGKVVFPRTASEREPPTAERTAGEISSQKLLIAPEIAEGYLLRRVEPEYPEDARLKGIQGAVVLRVLAGKDGTVKKVSPESGDRGLIDAATEAVRQWRFRPFFRNGEVTEFETRVTIHFKLP